MDQPFRAGMVGAARPLSPDDDAAERDGSTRGLFGGLLPDMRGVFGSFADFGAAPSPAPRGTFAELRHEGPAGARTYKLYVPARAEPDVALPLVVMLHGCNQSPDDLAAGTRMNAWAERDGFLVCYPAQASSANGQRCWNWFREADQRRGSGEPAVVVGTVRDVTARWPVDPARVYRPAT